MPGAQSSCSGSQQSKSGTAGAPGGKLQVGNLPRVACHTDGAPDHRPQNGRCLACHATCHNQPTVLQSTGPRWPVSGVPSVRGAPDPGFWIGVRRAVFHADSVPDHRPPSLAGIWRAKCRWCSGPRTCRFGVRRAALRADGAPVPLLAGTAGAPGGKLQVRNLPRGVPYERCSKSSVSKWPVSGVPCYVP